MDLYQVRLGLPVRDLQFEGIGNDENKAGLYATKRTTPLRADFHLYSDGMIIHNKR
jgi:hypothetical protein